MDVDHSNVWERKEESKNYFIENESQLQSSDRMVLSLPGWVSCKAPTYEWSSCHLWSRQIVVNVRKWLVICRNGSALTDGVRWQHAPINLLHYYCAHNTCALFFPCMLVCVCVCSLSRCSLIAFVLRECRVQKEHWFPFFLPFPLFPFCSEWCAMTVAFPFHLCGEWVMHNAQWPLDFPFICAVNEWCTMVIGYSLLYAMSDVDGCCFPFPFLSCCTRCGWIDVWPPVPFMQSDVNGLIIILYSAWVMWCTTRWPVNPCTV